MSNQTFPSRGHSRQHRHHSRGSGFVQSHGIKLVVTGSKASGANRGEQVLHHGLVQQSLRRDRILIKQRIGKGLSDIELGLRLRYEIRREFAPYVGITYSRKIGASADLARAAGEDAGETGVAVGIRAWF